MRAAKFAFYYSVDLEDYLAVKSWAGAAWETVKPELLAYLASSRFSHGKIDVYLYEEMHGEAIKAMGRRGAGDEGLIEKVVDAVYEESPDWAIKQCKKQVERILERGKSKYYKAAARWLRKAGMAYLAADRPRQWERYLEGLLEKHRRKYALLPYLEELRRLS